jgi:glycosyltransferase involved in cell wall biosynthesis
MNIVAVWAKVLSQVKSKVFLTLHSHISQSNAEDWIPWLAKKSYPLADGLIAVSKGVAEDHVKLLGLPSNTIQVLYNPAITPAIFAQAKQPIGGSIEKWLSTPYIVSVGRLSPEKDFSTLLKSFHDVKEAIPHNLLILGEGPMRGQLEEMVDSYDLRQRVLLAGYIENPYTVIAGADLLVSSSKWEGLPTVLIEALALGTKVVATDCAGSREVLQDGNLGVLVPVGNEPALSQAIVDAVTAKSNVSYTDTDAFHLYWHETAADNYLQYLSGKLR